MFTKNIIFSFFLFLILYIFNACSFSQNIGSSYDDSNSYYERTCNNGNINSCYNLGVSYENGIGVEQDYEKAYSFYKKACNYNMQSACYNLGVFYYNAYEIDKDIPKAKSLFLKACKLGNDDGCNHYSMLENKQKTIENKQQKEIDFNKNKKRLYVHRERRTIYSDGNQSREIYNQDINRRMIERKFIKVDRDGNYYEFLNQKGY